MNKEKVMRKHLMERDKEELVDLYLQVRGEAKMMEFLFCDARRDVLRLHRALEFACCRLLEICGVSEDKKEFGISKQMAQFEELAEKELMYEEKEKNCKKC